MKEQTRINKAISIIAQYGQIDGSDHKAWVLDQVARILNGKNYRSWVKAMKNDEDGPKTYDYDEGIPP